MSSSKSGTGGGATDDGDVLRKNPGLAAAIAARGLQVKKMLGRGGCGSAYLAAWKRPGGAPMDVVVKVPLHQDADTLPAARAEAECLRKLHHPNIIQLYDSFEYQECFIMVMELATGTPVDLAHYVIEHAEQNQRLPISEITQICVEVCSALAHCHHNKIIHRDIKHANIFRMADGSIKLGDFGIARSVSQVKQMLVTQMGSGTEPFMAPELKVRREFNWATDIFALGVTLYFMLALRFPFEHPLLGLLGIYPPLPPEICPPYLANLIGRMLALDPDDRPKAIDVLAEPEFHPDKLVVWRDPNVRNPENQATLHSLQAAYSRRVGVIACENDEDALSVIGLSSSDRTWVITNRRPGPGCAEGPAFLEACRDAGVENKALIFCANRTGLAPHPSVIVDTDANAVQKFIDREVLR